MAAKRSTASAQREAFSRAEMAAEQATTSSDGGLGRGRLRRSHIWR